jgi:hypothetical protein
MIRIGAHQQLSFVLPFVAAPHPHRLTKLLLFAGYVAASAKSTLPVQR